MVKKILKWLVLVVGSLVLIVGVLYFIYVRPVISQIEQQRIVEIDPNLTIVEGGGGNSGIFVSDSLVLVIDSKMGEGAQQLRDRVSEVAGGKPVIVVNTHYHFDHSSGNHLYMGDRVMAGAGYKDGVWEQEGKPEDSPRQWLEGSIDIPIGDDTVTLWALGFVAHTPGDVVAYSHKRKMLFAGDLILHGQVPSVANGTPQGYLDAFDLLQSKFDIQKIVPGHGATGGIEILETFRSYFNEMKTAAQNPGQADDLLAKYDGWIHVPIMMSSEQVIAGFKE